jgi:hypothetical protein
LNRSLDFLDGAHGRKLPRQADDGKSPRERTGMVLGCSHRHLTWSREGPGGTPVLAMNPTVAAGILPAVEPWHPARRPWHGRSMRVALFKRNRAARCQPSTAGKMPAATASRTFQRPLDWIS